LQVGCGSYLGFHYSAYETLSLSLLIVYFEGHEPSSILRIFECRISKCGCTCKLTIVRVLFSQPLYVYLPVRKCRISIQSTIVPVRLNRDFGIFILIFVSWSSGTARRAGTEMGCGASKNTVKSSAEKVQDLCWDDDEGGGTCGASLSLCGTGHPYGSCAGSCFLYLFHTPPHGSSLACYCPGAPRGHGAYSTASAVLHAAASKLEHAAEGAMDATHSAASALRHNVSHAASSADEAGKRALGLTLTPEEQEVFNAHTIVLAHDPSHTHICMHKCMLHTYTCINHMPTYTHSQNHTHSVPQTHAHRSTDMSRTHVRTNTTQAQLKEMNFHGSAVENAICGTEHHHLSSNARHEHHE
jgi:hypothetical protein